MKTTIATLLVLCGISAAETTNLLTSSTEWKCSNTSISNGVLQGTGQWTSGYADYTLGTPITLHFNMRLELSYTMTFLNRSDVAATVALHSSSDVLAFGAKTYNGPAKDAPLCIGYSTNNAAINANAITFSASNGYGYIFTDGSYTQTGKTAGIAGKTDDSTSSRVIKEVITWNDDAQKFVATIYVDGDEAGKQNLGSSYTLNKISVASAGNNIEWRSQPSFSNMQLTVTPEPTTATLSLLALMGLAARRRRRAA